MSELDAKTQLFTLRVWAIPSEGSAVEWRGKLQALPNGEAQYFHGWEELVSRLEAMLYQAGYPVAQSYSEDKGES
jgi:hypothetical protein